MSSVRVRVRARKSESRPLGLIAIVACKMDISDLSFSRQQLASDPNLIERQIAACDGNDSRIQAVRRLIMVGVRAIQPALHASLVRVRSVVEAEVAAALSLPCLHISRELRASLRTKNTCPLPETAG